ncbi:MAG: aminotransferase class V-fold PLP-dependent enzyme [Eubacteriales bacterium]|nr:aminotransferase class V-fold PLP-dependent enzyme [Eubacteriales bacterium]
MDKRPTTINESLQETLGTYARENSARFHMPGHKGRGLAGFWRDELQLWDVTELSNTDNLHAPQGAIAQAQDSMAQAYGAKSSFFVVNGGTNAVQAMILVLEEEDKLLLARDCHRSAVSGAALRGIETCYISPRYDEARGLLGMVTPEDLDQALTQTNATAVLITTPNAYGLCADVAGLAEAAHRHGALLMIDSAHGAHYPFSDALPRSLGGYADLFVHSQHKTMDALTQAASLHLGECRISPERLRRALAMTETTSPSYLLMASLDWSVYMARRRDWTGQVSRCIKLEEQIEAIDGFRVFHERIGIGVFERDRTRIVVDVTQRGYTGYEAQAILEENNIYLEMADARRLVLITTPNDEPIWYEQLLNALANLPKRRPRKTSIRGEEIRFAANEQKMRIREATFAKTQTIPLNSAKGRVAAEPIGIYPPGIALVMPGEVIDQRAIDYLMLQQQAGGALFGEYDGNVFVVE